MRQRGGRRAGWIIFVIALAAVCVAGAELLVCRFADPQRYEALTAPVRGFFRGLGEDAGVYADAVREELEYQADRRAEEKARRRAEEAAAREAALAESQKAGEARIRAVYVPADPAITELVTIRGREYLLGGNLELQYFNQGDPAWAEEKFGVDPIGEYGCGPTCLAMAVSSMGERTVDPAQMAEWTGDNGYACPGSGAYHAIVEGTAEHFGLDCASLPDLDADGLRQTLALSGGAMVALMGPGHFTKGGHFILLHGVTLTGDILVADPFSRERSLTVWDPQLILDELSWSRDSGAPLWLLTPRNET